MSVLELVLRIGDSLAFPAILIHDPPVIHDKAHQHLRVQVVLCVMLKHCLSFGRTSLRGMPTALPVVLRLETCALALAADSARSPAILVPRMCRTWAFCGVLRQWIFRRASSRYRRPGRSARSLQAARRLRSRSRPDGKRSGRRATDWRHWASRTASARRHSSVLLFWAGPRATRVQA